MRCQEFPLSPLSRLVTQALSSAAQRTRVSPFAVTPILRTSKSICLPNIWRVLSVILHIIHF